jgi:hypothetical protein
MADNVFLNLNELEKSAKAMAPYILNPRKFIEAFVMISKKDGSFGKMKLNKAQRLVMDEIERRMANNMPVRIRILKSRQQGATALCVALGMWWACCHENASYAVVAHKETSASSIYDRARMIYNNLPREIKPMTSKFNSERIFFDGNGGEIQGLRSRVFFGTAGGGELFRGETINFLHKSEKAFWDDANGVLDKSLNATVPKLPNTFIIDETTANGYNRFKDEWDRSVRGENDYSPIFLAWYLTEEYQMAVPKDFKMTEAEKKLALRYDLTKEQIYWRRYTIENDFEGREMFFDQEYPISPEVAFIASGMGVFGGDLTREGYDGVVEPIKEEINGMMVEPLLVFEQPEIKEEIEYGDKVVFDEKEQRWVNIHNDIIVGQTTRVANYTLGIDTAGLGQNKNVIAVWHNIKKECVAVWRQQTISEELLADVAIAIAKKYNDALIACETNFSHAVYDYLTARGYKNLYLREKVDSISKSPSAVYGWHTSNRSKAMIISHLKKTLTDNPQAIKDKEFWFEAEYFILEDPSRNIMNAAAGHNDDTIMANAIACYVCSSFQAKQTYSSKTVERKNTKVAFPSTIGYNVKRRRTKLKKGIYKNNA